MAIDRDTTLKNAEKLLRGGRLDAAIAEYSRVVEDQPSDWNSANVLGDLYIRTGHPVRAVPLYRRIAEHLLAEGFYPKAAALFKKVLKITPDDDEAQLRLAEISATQELLADARSHYRAVEARRRQRGDADGADEVLVRLGALDPEDLDARLAAAQAAERRGRMAEAATLYRALYDDYLERGRQADASAALRHCLRLRPEDREIGLLLPLAAVEMSEGRLQAAHEALEEFVVAGGAPAAITRLAWTVIDTNPNGAAICVETAADAHVGTGAFGEAAGLLREFNRRVPNRIPVLLRLVEVCVDGGLEPEMFEAQAQLADAYLLVGQAAEARCIAEDLVARNPADAEQSARLRRALEMLGVDDVDGVLAGQVTSAAGQVPVVGTPVDPPAAGIPAVPQPPAPDAARREPSSPGNVEIDLTSALGELQGAGAPPLLPGPPTPTLDAVFDALRAGVAGDAAEGDTAEHLGLARTYLEMGMTDDAIGALEVAARSPSHRFAASSMLAQIHRDQSDLVRAIEWFERAAEAPAPTPDEGRALLYDLGDVLETVGETARALAVLLELQTDDPGYRDVGTRVTRLSKVETEG